MYITNFVCWFTLGATMLTYNNPIRLLDVFRSYYGGLICVCWSPDGKYIVTGGQDDLVTIWSLPERRIIARCQGHNSWVTAVAFDPWRCDERTYRFGSVGDDCRLLLWDFSVGMLHRPKVVSVIHQSIPCAGCLMIELTVACCTVLPTPRKPTPRRQHREPRNA